MPSGYAKATHGIDRVRPRGESHVTRKKKVFVYQIESHHLEGKIKYKG